MQFHLAPWANAAVSSIDNAGITWAESLRGYGGADHMHSGLTEFMKLLSEVFDPTIVIIASCLIVAFFMTAAARARDGKKAYWRFAATRFLISILSISGIVWIAKNLIVRARPAGSLVAETGFSFPSGHAAVSLVFFALLYMSLSEYLSGRAGGIRIWRWIGLILALLMPVLIGFSRVYLGVHYLSDVLAGFVFGAIVAALAMLSSERYRRVRLATLNADDDIGQKAA